MDHVLDRQVDLDIREPATWTYLCTVIDRLTAAGVTMLRLDAVGYVGKVAGTDCFMTAESVAFVNRISDYADERGAKILVEVHGHYLQQLETARIVDYVYDFALPPLVLHALITGDAVPLDAWLAIRPVNTVTVLDTHDGIGVVDVGPNELRPGHAGLLTAEQIDDLVESSTRSSGGTSRLASGAAATNLDLYQINCTFYDALGADDSGYLLARLIQLFVPGIPQIYYVGLLAGRNDVALLAETGVGRDVNRHRYSLAEVETELRRYVVRAQLNALRFRAQHPAFRGTFTHYLDGQRLQLRWRTDEHEACLDADVSTVRTRSRSLGTVTANRCPTRLTCPPRPSVGSRPTGVSTGERGKKVRRQPPWTVIPRSKGPRGSKWATIPRSGPTRE